MPQSQVDVAVRKRHLADGGETKPRLGIWRNCRRDPSCKPVTDDPECSVLQCGADTVTLEVLDGRTILRGSFGERIVGPAMKVERMKRERRDAAVDC